MNKYDVKLPFLHVEVLYNSIYKLHNSHVLRYLSSGNGIIILKRICKFADTNQLLIHKFLNAQSR